MSEQQLAWAELQPCSGNFSKYIRNAGCYIACVLLVAACGGGGGGKANANAQGGGSVPAPSLSFSSSNTSVAPGGSVTLTWQAQNADSCQASGGWSGDRAVSGSATIGPLQQTQTFSLSCSGSGGGALREVAVNVTQDSSVEVTLSSDASVVLVNGQVNLTWNASNADSCEASGAWSGQLDSNGTFTSAPLTEDVTFKISCFAQGDSAVSLVSVQVTDKTIRWQAPTENVDGSALTDLAGFKVYWGPNSRDYSGNVELGANTRQWEIPLGSGEYYLAVTAIDADADESSYSNEVRKLIP